MNEGLQSVSFIFATIIIILSASGLFGWVSLSILRRSKEVGIRKLLGASIPYLMTLVSRDFILNIAFAFTVGSLITYVIINNIIFRFIYAYHAELSLDIFVSTLGLVMLSCCATIGWKVYVASSSNPIKVLHKK